MRKKIRPSDVTFQYKWEVYPITNFLAATAEDMNDGTLANLIWAWNEGDLSLAHDIIELEQSELSPADEIVWRKRINARLKKLHSRRGHGLYTFETWREKKGK